MILSAIRNILVPILGIWNMNHHYNEQNAIERSRLKLEEGSTQRDIQRLAIELYKFKFFHIVTLSTVLYNLNGQGGMKDLPKTYEGIKETIYLIGYDTIQLIIKCLYMACVIITLLCISNIMIYLNQYRIKVLKERKYKTLKAFIQKMEMDSEMRRSRIICISCVPLIITHSLYGVDLNDYMGQINWCGSRPYGLGKLETKEGIVFIGEWKKNGLPRRGKRIDDSGTYFGSVNHSFQPHGPGIYNYTDGNMLDGDWKNGHFSGKGKFNHLNGDVYEGEFKDNNAHGQGKMTCTNGSVYEGEWTDGKYNGPG